MAGITAWLVGQMGLLGVDVRFNAYAEAADILSERPDVVVVATGGRPNVGKFDGAELAAATWDVLAGHVACERDILLIDENGSAPGLSCAEFAAARGSNVRLATPDREIGRELGGTNLGAHMTELYKLGVTIEVDIRLVSIVKSGNKLLGDLGEYLYRAPDRTEGRPGDRRKRHIAERRGLFRPEGKIEKLRRG